MGSRDGRKSAASKPWGVRSERCGGRDGGTGAHSRLPPSLPTPSSKTHQSRSLHIKVKPTQITGDPLFQGSRGFILGAEKVSFGTSVICIGVHFSPFVWVPNVKKTQLCSSGWKQNKRALQTFEATRTHTRSNTGLKISIGCERLWQRARDNRGR